jgi:mannose-1-phosphate guanylyltransferase/mannose-6-phosphate isomerase
MIRDTAMRFHEEDGFAPSIVICNETYAGTIAGDFATGGPQLAALIAEPARRDTAAAAALAAFHIQGVDPSGYVLLLPSDHHIRHPAEFANAIRAAANYADNAINTFGVVPARPDTGFGYIKRDDSVDKIGSLYKIDTFVEKPDAATAQSYLDTGAYYWNAGIFLFRPTTFLNELKRLQPRIYDAVKRAWDERRTTPSHGTPVHIPSDSFLGSDSISLDYAVMEKTTAATVMPIDIGWDDLGSWDAMRDMHDQDGDGNVARGDAHVFECKNTYLESSSRLVVASGVSDVIVIDTADALLICGSGASQGVKAVHASLVDMGRKEAEYHPDLTSRRLGLRKWYRDWLLKDVMPLWSGIAIDANSGIPSESLSYDGEPIDETVRTRVISRQIFTFAFAADQFGWDLDRAKTLIASLCDVYMEKVRLGNGSVARLNRAGTVVDDTWDTYDQAFHILAMAWAYRATGDARYVVFGQEAMGELQETLKHATRGYKEDSTGSGPRRANPHMHLLEASLAWFSTPLKATFAPLAEEVVDIFHNNFCCDGLLFERFDETLSRVEDPDSDIAIEPGHLYEWATLIKLAADEGVRPNVAGKVAAMVGFTDVYGQNTDTGLAYDTGSADGHTMSGTHRLWPQTEKVRHHLLYGTSAQQAQALDSLETIRRLYLNPGEAKGLWRDKLSGDLKDMGDRSPASTLYHLINMIAII